MGFNPGDKYSYVITGNLNRLTRPPNCSLPRGGGGKGDSTTAATGSFDKLNHRRPHRHASRLPPANGLAGTLPRLRGRHTRG